MLNRVLRVAVFGSLFLFPVRVSAGAKTVTCLAFGPDGTLASSGDDRTVVLWTDKEAAGK